MQGNDSLGIGKVVIKWQEPTHSMGRMMEVSSKEAISYISTLKDAECTNIRVNDMDAEDYINMRRGNPK